MKSWTAAVSSGPTTIDTPIRRGGRKARRALAEEDGAGGGKTGAPVSTDPKCNSCHLCPCGEFGQTCGRGRVASVVKHLRREDPVTLHSP